MSIYNLYIKTHRKTGFKYLGQTRRNPFKYKGSGVHWRLHLKKHGEDIDTEIIAKCETLAELECVGLFFSQLFNVVESEEWANLCEETGRGGVLGFKHSAEYVTRLRRPKTEAQKAALRVPKPNARGQKKGPRTAEHKAAIGAKNRGRKYSDAVKADMSAKKTAWWAQRRAAAANNSLVLAS